MPNRTVAMATVMLAALASLPASAHNHPTSACMDLWSKARQAEHSASDAHDIQRLIAPFASACATEIASTPADAALSTHQDQLRALDTLSFYFNATSQQVPFALADLAATLAARFPSDGMDPASSESVRAIEEENRSVQWMRKMNLERKMLQLKQKRATSTEAIVLKLVNGHLKAESLDLSKVDVVVVAGCHMARRATEQLLKDQKASQALSGLRIIWMQPAGRSLHLKDVEEWNQAFPDAPMHIAYQNSQWRGMDLTVLPTFHLLRQGNVVGSHRGWSRDGTPPPPLIEALENLRAR